MRNDPPRRDGSTDHGTAHRYPPAALSGGYLRAGIGVAASLGVAFAGHESGVLSVICVTLSTVFLAYGVRTAIRGASVVTVDSNGLHVSGPLARGVQWNDLTDLRLAYYTTRRDGENGWMELTLRGRYGRMTVDSDIEGFSDIATRCRAEAEARGIAPSLATMRNFIAISATARPASRA